MHTPASETREGKFCCIVRESLQDPAHTASLEIRSVETAEDSLSDCFIFLCCYFPQFNDHDFGGLSGGRIVRIATHPDFQGVSWMVRTFRRLFYPILLCNTCWNTLHMTWLFWTSSPGSSVSSKWDEVGLVTRLRLILLVTCAFIMNSIAFTVSQMPFSCIDRTKRREYVVSFSMWRVE